MAEKYIVRIIEDATGKVVRQMQPTASERQADRLAAAVSLNLNHDAFSVEVVPESQAKAEFSEAVEATIKTMLSEGLIDGAS